MHTNEQQELNVDDLGLAIIRGGLVHCLHGGDFEDLMGADTLYYGMEFNSW